MHAPSLGRASLTRALPSPPGRGGLCRTAPSAGPVHPSIPLLCLVTVSVAFPVPAVSVSVTISVYVSLSL